jgi:RNA polymerase sigma-70 factor (ECF subfamily)
MGGHGAARREEFESLAFEHLGALHAFARRLTHDPTEAEDLVQEAILKAYRAFDSFQRGSNGKAWLFRILKNSFINDWRKRKVRPATVDFDAVADRHEDLLDELQVLRLENPEEALDRAILAGDVEDGLRDMATEYRLVVLLCLVQGFTYQEAADALEIPIGTVMSRLHRGRKFLQARLLQQARDRGLAGLTGAAESAGDVARSPPGKG